MCGVDWQHELGEASDGVTLYPGLKSLMAARPCWKRCGVVRVKVRLSKWVVGQDLK